MGLDMYLYKAEKPELNTRKVHKYSDLSNEGYAIFEANEDGSLPHHLTDLRPFLVRLRCTARYYDIAKIRECFGLPEDAHWSGFGSDGIHFSGCTESGEYKRITIAHDQCNEFTYEKQSIFYVTMLDEVGYWRKHYTLDDKLTKHFMSTRGIVVENCGYYRMTKAAMHIVENYVKKYETEGVFYDPEEIRSLFYHNSY